MNRITAAALLTLLAAAAPATAQTPVAPRQIPAQITVSGEGSVDRVPDQATVSFAIVTNDDVAARATSANNTAYNALVARLRGLGIDAAAIKTTSYDLSYNQRPPQPNPQFQQRYGYVVSRGVSVTTNRTDQAGAIVDAGVAAGVSNVNGVAFGLRDSRGAYRAALAAAFADAEAQAQALAAAAHLRIVRVFSIGDGSYAVPRPFGPMTAASARAGVPTEIQPSDQTTTATVSVTFQVAP
ncbi:MAG: SIMPL domain-containing protein [Candidatus Eremiobacteraeota bacterium]|nr:SIMPL domain-containing protein [Candidatus Eremiobacteraeota bacterium]